MWLWGRVGVSSDWRRVMRRFDVVDEATGYVVASGLSWPEAVKVANDTSGATVVEASGE